MMLLIAFGWLSQKISNWDAISRWANFLMSIFILCVANFIQSNTTKVPHQKRNENIMIYGISIGSK
ncbi:hypothetical protein Q7O_002667 [Pectobacterium carotovorum subsp. carotovorum PCCS1]|nr:hypothetical protein [Pectobacterium carotovorum subsp. carotovorum PCCS1]